MKKWILMVAVLTGVGCASEGGGVKEEGRVGHVVVFWLKRPGDVEHRKTIVEASKRFAAIPGVVSVKGGGVVPSTRPVVDSTFDVAVVIEFEDEEAMRAYEGHPIHQEAVKGVLREVVERVRVYDLKYE